jgi:hypothetical protein
MKISQRHVDYIHFNPVKHAMSRAYPMASLAAFTATLSKECSIGWGGDLREIRDRSANRWWARFALPTYGSAMT